MALWPPLELTAADNTVELDVALLRRLSRVALVRCETADVFATPPRALARPLTRVDVPLPSEALSPSIVDDSDGNSPRTDLTTLWSPLAFTPADSPDNPAELDVVLLPRLSRVL
jgi:hypothetical protein